MTRSTRAAGSSPGQPVVVRRRDARAGGRAVAGRVRVLFGGAGRSARADRVEAGAARRPTRSARRWSGRDGRPALRRRHHLDAHVLAGEDVDRWAGRAAQAVAALPHPVQRVVAVGRHRHGLHEPQPGRARRPRVRLHRDPDAGAPQDRRGSRQRPGLPAPDRRLGTGCRRLPHLAEPAAGPVRRQHARRRGDRGRQGRGADALRHVGQHLSAVNDLVAAVDDGRRRCRRRAARRRTRRTYEVVPELARRRRAARVAASTAPGWRWRCAASSTEPAGSTRSPPTSRTSAGCVSCRVSPCSG